MGFFEALGGVARAFIPKEEAPPPEPAQIMIVDGRQRTRKEELQDWLNGNDPPDRITRIHNNIERMNAMFNSPVDGESEDMKTYHPVQKQQPQNPFPVSRRERDMAERQRTLDFKNSSKSGYKKKPSAKIRKPKIRKPKEKDRFSLRKWKI